MLKKEKQVRGLGVDNDPAKVLECIRKGIPVYQSDVDQALKIFADQSFDRVILSRTIDHLVW